MDIKICGISTVETTDAVIAGGASHIGFIFFEKSPRHVTPDIAAQLGARAQSHGLKSVAVTVNAHDDALDEIVTVLKPDILQLHGAETPDQVIHVKNRYGLPVMKAFAIASRADLAKIEAYKSVADRLLFDAKAPKDSNLPGGNGISFDWSLLEGLDPLVDYMLSGGLNAENVGDALVSAKPRGLDVSSGVESTPGVKDTKLIASFFDAIADAKKVREQ